MKINFLSAVFVFFSWILPVEVRSQDFREILFELKKPTTCTTLKDSLARKKIFIKCSSTEKKRYFDGHYVGTRPISAIIIELKKDSRFTNVTHSTKIKLVR